METILVQVKNGEELKLIERFLQQHQLKSHVLTDDDKEDIVLGKMMEETNHNEIVDTNSFLAKLKN